MFACGQKSQLSSITSCFVEEVICVPWYCDGDYNILNIYFIAFLHRIYICRSTDFFPVIPS